jgi:hypothetical protein
MLDDLVRGRWLPVLGAGFSANAAVPEGSKMPRWNELGAELAAEIPGYQPSGAVDSISAYEAAYGRPRLVERIARALLAGRAAPGEAHRAFCEMPFETVLTTNFDLLLEDQYTALRRVCHPILDESQLSILNPYDGPTLVKFHGDIHHPEQLVATEDDYDSFLVRKPMLATYITALLVTKVAVLIGYSLDDPDFRQLLAVVADRLGSNKLSPWVVTLDADPTTLARFTRRGVRVVNLKTGRQGNGEALAFLFDELRDYWLRNVPSVTRPTSHRLADFTVRVSPSPLCTFSVPGRLVDFYVDLVFPAVEDAGLTPVNPMALATPEGSATAASAALLSTAAAAVVDVGDGTGWFDLAIARERNPRAAIVVVTSDDAYVPPGATDDLPLVRRPREPLEVGEDLVQSIVNALTDRQGLHTRWAADPVALLSSGATGPAVVLSYTLLETALRERNSARTAREKSGRQVGTMTIWLRRLEDEGVIDGSELNELLAGWKLRSEVVHGDASVSMARAQPIVALVTKVLRRLGTEG